MAKKRSSGKAGRATELVLPSNTGTGGSPAAESEDPYRRVNAIYEDRYGDDDDPESIGDDCGSHEGAELVSLAESAAGDIGEEPDDDDDPNEFLIPQLRDTHEAIASEPGTFGVRAIIGEDNRKQVVTTTDYPFRAICALLMTNSSGQQAVGTAWFVSPTVLVTAGHNLMWNELIGTAAKVDVYPGRNGMNGIWLQETVDSSRCRVSQQWAQSKDQSLDFGVIALTQPLGKQAGWFGMAPWTASQLSGKNFNVIGYPSLQNDPYTQWWDVGNITRVGQQTLQYEMDTTGGESGCPVIAWDSSRSEQGSMLVVGIHNYGFENLGYNQATRVTPDVITEINKLIT